MPKSGGFKMKVFVKVYTQSTRAG